MNVPRVSISNVNAAVARNFAQKLLELGVTEDRVRLHPEPGRATLEDLIAANDHGGMCELVDGTLVEKAVGWTESLLAMFLGELIGKFSRQHNLGFVTGPDGFVKILDSMVRGPDVAFVSWARLPDQKPPQDPVPEIVPDFVIEVLSVSNTFAEMARKRREYFHAGVQLVWMVDPRERTVAVFTSITDVTVVDENATLDGGDVLPGLQVSLVELFAELDRLPPERDV